jgi:DNA-binding SARP family transcriptional activator/tetratricopeptide (TPR) repeat protein
MGTTQPLFAVLGPLDVRLGGRSLPLGGVRNQLVLAALLLQEGRTVTVDELADTVWDGAPPATVRKQIQAAVSQVRRALGTAKGLVRTHGFGYQLVVGAGQLDVNRFSGMVGEARASAARGEFGDAADGFRAALRLWRGRPLAGLPGSVVEQHATRLEELRLAVLEECAECELRLGRHRQLIPELQAIARALPLRERVTGLLMTALAGDGRQAEAISVYHEQAAVLREELGVDPGPLLHRMYVEMLQGPDRALANGAARPGEELPVRPAQLPADIRGFAGRTAAIAELDRHAAGLTEEDRAVVIVGLSGTAGVGKTTLAVHWAHRVAGRFPDGQLYVNLRGFDPGGRTTEPADAVRRFLDALGVPATAVPRGLEAQAALYRSLISGRRMLVVLDNAHDADQVRPLLPGNASVIVLVTSRNRLTGLVAIDGARPLSLGVMSPAESRELLLRRLGADRVQREEEHAARVVTLCAGLPLALAIVSARAQETSFPLAALAGELGQAGRQLDSLDAGDSLTRVRAVFSWSYRALTTAGAHLFRLLGLHPGTDFGIRAAESLAGTDVRAGLTELTRASLLIEYGSGRYALHDLLRAYAMELISESDRPDEAFARLADHYLHSATAADRLLNPLRSTRILELAEPATGTSIDDAADPAVWFAAERANLLAILGRAAETGLDRQTWQLAWAADTALERLGHWQDFVGSWELALGVTRDPRARAYAHRRLAHGFTLLGREAEAEAQLRAVLRLYEEAGDLTGQAITHHSLSYMYDTLDNVDRALHHSELAVACSERTGDTDELARALNAVGWCHVRLGDHARALTYCRRALTLIDPANHRTLADTWDTIGYAHHHLGEYARAADAYRTALAMARKAEDRYLEATLLTHLGDTYVATGDREAAGAAWRPAIDLLATIDESAAATLRHRLADLGA